MRKTFLPMALCLFLVLILSTSALAVGVPFSVDEPDGTADSTSGYYTINWTPAFGWLGLDANMIDGINTISCYASTDNSLWTVDNLLFTGRACCKDANTYPNVPVYGLGGREIDAQYYVWCINDQNSDQNAYSGGAFTLSRYAASDLGLLGLDIPGGVLGAIAFNATSIGTLIAILLIITILVDLITNTIGIIALFRSIAGRQRG